MGTTSKAISLLDHFSRARPELGLSDLARASGVNKATCFRLMTELVEHGLIEQTVAKTYRIGPAVLRLAALREAAVPLRDGAQAVLRDLAETSGETAHMSHLIAGRLSVMAFAYSGRPGVKVMMEDEDILPLHATSSGNAVLAWLQADTPVVLAPRAPGTPRTVEALQARLAQVQARGWAESESTYEADIASLALPLFDSGARVMGALSVAGPIGRMGADRRATLVAPILKAALRMMDLWGGQPPDNVAALWRRVEGA